jgi:formylglycine-generating enzyme required for sulfatase activity
MTTRPWIPIAMVIVVVASAAGLTGALVLRPGPGTEDAGAGAEAITAPLPSPPAWAEAHGQDVHGRWADLAIAGVVQRFRWISPGSFVMGASDEEVDDAWRHFQRAMYEAPRSWFEAPQHRVTLTRGFWMADTPCTQRMWQAVMGDNPSRFRGMPDRPVEQVSWRDATVFIDRASGLTRSRAALRLPTEAEWEWACRAGTTAALYTGPIVYHGYNMVPAVDAVAWFQGNSGQSTHVVKEKAPNPWGLYDLFGNVWEWCGDRFGPYTVGGVTDPVGAASGDLRSSRGGSWADSASSMYAGHRTGRPEHHRSPSWGFRLVIDSDLTSAPAGPGSATPPGF